VSSFDLHALDVAHRAEGRGERHELLEASPGFRC
jgi:hypothetical protein